MSNTTHALFDPRRRNVLWPEPNDDPNIPYNWGMSGYTRRNADESDVTTGEETPTPTLNFNEQLDSLAREGGALQNEIELINVPVMLNSGITPDAIQGLISRLESLAQDIMRRLQELVPPTDEQSAQVLGASMFMRIQLDTISDRQVELTELTGVVPTSVAPTNGGDSMAQIESEFITLRDDVSGYDLTEWLNAPMPEVDINNTLIEWASLAQELRDRIEAITPTSAETREHPSLQQDIIALQEFIDQAHGEFLGDLSLFYPVDGEEIEDITAAVLPTKRKSISTPLMIVGTAASLLAVYGFATAVKNGASMGDALRSGLISSTGIGLLVAKDLN